METCSRRDTLFFTLALSAGAIAAHASFAAAPVSVGGWREAVLVVPALAPWIEVLTTVGGWQVAGRGNPGADLNSLWSLPAGASTEQALMRNTVAQSGMLRLVALTGAPQRRIRPHDQAWETGGVQALDIRVLDMDATIHALEARGWNSASDPVRYTTYGKDVSQWAPRSPDGIRISFIQRLAPPLPDVSMLKPWGPAANAAVTVRDMAKSRAFLSSVLGLRQVSQSSTVGGDGPNVMGLPWSMQRMLKVEISGYAGQNGGDGAIELISLPEALGRDYAAEARPPNLGTAALRCVVTDAATLGAQIQAAGIQLAVPVQDVAIAPYGKARAFAVSSPDGVWIEFAQYTG